MDPSIKLDWFRLSDNLVKSYNKTIAMDKSVQGGVLEAPLVCVDRTNGNLYAFPQSGALWVSHDQGQTFEWLNKDVPGWGFNESPTSLFISQDGNKMRIFSSKLSGYSIDNGLTWKYMNFKINYGFEDGHVNWHSDSKMIIARSHTWPKARMWLSRDGGESFTEFSKEITEKINTQSIALMESDVMLFEKGGKLVRTEDYGETFTEVLHPTYQNKNVNNAFIGVSRKFKDKVYWLNNIGVFTSQDKGNTWQLVGNNFPIEWITERSHIRSGPIFGKDENHMIVMCSDKFIESVDGGKTWHILAYAPVHFDSHPWSYSFAYDPIDDILYCNSRGHAGGPFLFGRLALKRWGTVEAKAPTDPSGINVERIEPTSNIKVSWLESKDSSGIAWYRIYINDELRYYTDKTSFVLPDVEFESKVDVKIQAVDTWQNMSNKVSCKINLDKKPKSVVFLKDLIWQSAKTDIGELSVMSDVNVTNKKEKPFRHLVDLFEPSPVKKYASAKSVNCVGILAESNWKKGILTYALSKKYKKLIIDIGLERGGWNNLNFSIKVNDKEVVKIEKVTYGENIKGWGRPVETYEIDLTNAETLSFETEVIQKRYWDKQLIILNNGILLE